MRIIVNGQQAFGKAVLERLLSEKYDVVAVYCAPDAQGGRTDPLKKFAIESGITVYQPESYKEASVLDQIVSLQSDLCVMAYVTLMIPESILNAPTLGTIQYHPSLLPKHRGPSAINWPIIFGESVTGLSIFWPDEGIDTGPILMQKQCAIGSDDTLGSLYFDKLFPMGVSAMVEAVDLVRKGEAPSIAQPAENVSYEGWCGLNDAFIDWSRSADQLHDLIRGCDPQPGAWTTLNGKRMQLFGSSKVESVLGPPGSVISSKKDLVVSTGDGGIRVQKVRLEREPKVTSEEFISDVGAIDDIQLGS
ncbi:MAG: methionyl-tRNA formyltransferase [Acidiferrobacteraceae bacterium]|nr:methionyl-tRNA formyltransferase [Acidiferrobacteraceae bacterium]